MCGIAGIISPRLPAETREAAVARMCDAMLHRGPDDAGLESSGPATLGMRRLAIFDPANGHQPMVTPDGRYRIVFNGAIYNFAALKAELAEHGHSFRTQCDTEVLLAAYVAWGETLLPRLRGMFAFAVWDRDEQRLFFARDPFGIKPLYYREQVDGGLLFASEINALLASGECPADSDPVAVADYLAWFAVPAPRTLYRGVRSLRPGECAHWRRGRLEVRTHWSFAATEDNLPVCGSAEEFTRELRARLEDTIRAHVVADVPVGAFLSGGLDSAAVVGLMTRSGSARLRTFSIGFGEAAYSEADAAAATARHFGTEHHASVLTGARVAADLDRILGRMDQPSGDGINTYYASEAARTGGVTVALSGVGGDELFGGYPSFRAVPQLTSWTRWWQRLPELARHVLLAQLRRGDTRRRKLADFLEFGTDPARLSALQRRVFDEPARLALLEPDVRRLAAGEGPLHPELGNLGRELAGAGAFDLVSAWELRTYMADVLLRDSDVMSMAHSLELRVPFIDRPLVAWLRRQPAEFRDTPQHPKTALATALADLLPPGMAARPKQGFTLPFPIWMRGELRPFLEETFSAASVGQSGMFAAPAVRQLWQGYLAKHDTREWSRVWSLAILIASLSRRASPISSVPTAARFLTAARPAPAPAPALPGRSLLLAPEIFASEGGIPRILQIYLRALCELSPATDQVRLLSLNDPASVDPAGLARCGAANVLRAEGCGRSKVGFVRAALRLSRNCDRVICGHVGQLPVAWAAKRMNPRLKYYLVAHGIEVWRNFGAAERVALRDAEKILCVSDYTRQELLRRCPLPEGKAIVLWNALDPEFPIAPGRPLAECPPVILTVTRLTFTDRYKGVEDMIAAMPAIRLAVPEAVLRLVGRGDDVPRLRALAERSGVADAIQFLGYLSDRDLTREIHACRLFALPSKKEGFGLVFLEAMARGRPCLGARAGGVPEVITPGSGVLVNYGDIPGIATSTIAALNHPWAEAEIMDRARSFSYSPFRDRLATVLTE
jgi:asparagine synthase (glutamine-hydrolysing)